MSGFEDFMGFVGLIGAWSWFVGMMCYVAGRDNERQRQLGYRHKKCSECGKYIDILDALLTKDFPMGPRCLSDAIRGRTGNLYKAFSSVKKEKEI